MLLFKVSPGRDRRSQFFVKNIRLWKAQFIRKKGSSQCVNLSIPSRLLVLLVITSFVAGHGQRKISVYDEDMKMLEDLEDLILRDGNIQAYLEHGVGTCKIFFYPLSTVFLLTICMEFMKLICNFELPVNGLIGQKHSPQSNIFANRKKTTIVCEFRQFSFISPRFYVEL